MSMDADDSVTPSTTQISQAAQWLIQGRLVAFPTETVYGLGADAENPQAIQKIYAAKQRPPNHPLIVHLAPDADISYWTSDLSKQAQALIDAFWPGPLTLILPRAPHIPSAVSGGQPTIGLRCPAHPVASALLSSFAALKRGGQGGVAAPSANKFGHVSPTRAAHVRSEFPELPPDQLLVLEGGRSAVGIESTIVDLSDTKASGEPVLLRPGHIRPEQIAEVLGVMPGRPNAASPQVSGSLKAHYAPRTPLQLVPSCDLQQSIRENALLAAKNDGRIAAVVFKATADSGLPVDYYVCPGQADAYARDLYDILRRLDDQAYDALLIEQPPLTVAWQAVNDRLGRAAAAFL